MDNSAFIYFFGIGILGIAYYAYKVRYAQKRVSDHMKARHLRDFEITRTSIYGKTVAIEVEYTDVSGVKRENSCTVYGWILPDSDIYWEKPF